MPLREYQKQFLKRNLPTETHLDLSNSGLWSEDLSELQELLVANSYITSIDLSNNNLRSEGMIYLALCLHRLKLIDLSDNSIADKGIDFLLSATHSQLEGLNVVHNGLTNISAQRLLAILQREETKLQAVTIHTNNNVDIELADHIHCLSRKIPYIPGQETEKTRLRNELDIDLGKASSAINQLRLSQFSKKNTIIPVPHKYVEEKKTFQK